MTFAQRIAKLKREHGAEDAQEWTIKADRDQEKHKRAETIAGIINRQKHAEWLAKAEKESV